MQFVQIAQNSFSAILPISSILHKKVSRALGLFLCNLPIDKAKGLVLRLRLSTQEQSNTLHHIDKNHKKYYNKRKRIERSDNTMITLQFTLFSTTGIQTSNYFNKG